MSKSGDVATVSIFKMLSSFWILCLIFLGYVYISGFFISLNCMQALLKKCLPFLGSGPKAKAKTLICLIVREIN